MNNRNSEIVRIENQIGQLALGDVDRLVELLRRRNQLLNGDLNKTDQQLIRERYAPLVARLADDNCSLDGK